MNYIVTETRLPNVVKEPVNTLKGGVSYLTSIIRDIEFMGVKGGSGLNGI